MNIIIESEFTNLGKISNGTCVMLNDEYYIVTDQATDDWITVVNLDTGAVEEYGYSKEVKRINMKGVISI